VAPVINGRQYSDELQASGKFGPLSLTLGGYADLQRLVGPQERSYIVQFGRVQRASLVLPRTTSTAVYGNGELDLGSLIPGFKLNGGIRYTKDTNRAQAVTYQYVADPTVSNNDPNRPIGICANYGGAQCASLQQNSSVVTYEAGASYDLGRVFLYGAFRRGYRPGGINVTVDPSKLIYLPENNYEFEIGAKAQFRVGDMPVRFNIAAYHDAYKSIQKATSYQFNGATTTNIQNIANGRIKGIEYELTIEPVAALTVGISGAYTDAKYDIGTQDLFGPTGACNTASFTPLGFCTLNRLMSTPENTISVNVTYVLPVSETLGKITLGGDYYHQSSSSLGPASYQVPSAVEAPYGLLNLNMSWEGIAGSPLDLRVFVTNVANKIYRISTSAQDYRGGYGIAASVYGEPRMVGVSLRYRFGADAR